MTPETVAIIVNAWIDYQDHDHDLPGHLGSERIADFSQKMANKLTEPEQPELSYYDRQEIKHTREAKGCVIVCLIGLIAVILGIVLL